MKKYRDRRGRWQHIFRQHQDLFINIRVTFVKAALYFRCHTTGRCRIVPGLIGDTC